MKINRIQHKTNAVPSPIVSDDLFSARIGFWADVISVDSVNNRVDVVNDQGLEFYDIPVLSRQWVIENDGYVSGERNLPPVNARVFILVPDGVFDNAFVLCSGFPSQESSLKTLFAQNENEKEQKNNIKEIVTQGGWIIQENYLDGNLSLTSKDGRYSFNINLSDNSELSQSMGVSFTLGNLSLSVTDDDGVTITNEENKITLSGDGITISDADNEIKMTSDGVDINGYLTVAK